MSKGIDLFKLTKLFIEYYNEKKILYSMFIFVKRSFGPILRERSQSQYPNTRMKTN